LLLKFTDLRAVAQRMIRQHAGYFGNDFGLVAVHVDRRTTS
jgi:hypothetical protein